jgi:hypothetical protein
VDPTDIFRLILAVGVAPVVWRLGRGLRLPGVRHPFALMYVTITLAYAATILEKSFWREAFNMAQHGLSAVAGLAFCWAAYVVLREARRVAEDDS